MLSPGESQPCVPETASIQSDCGPGKQKCATGPDEGLCKQIGYCRPPYDIISTPPNCAKETGDTHPECVYDSGNHHESFISGISNNFKKFTNSLTNKNKKSIPTRIKSFSKDNNFSYV